MLTTLFISSKVWLFGVFMPFVTFAATKLEPFADHPGCTKGAFLNFPTWYKYLNTPVVDGAVKCNPAISGINDFWLIGLAVIEILLRVAILVAIIYVMLGGIKYITARGDTGGSGGGPNKINQARTTVLDALLGLIIAIIATAGVSYIAGRFTA